MNDHTITLTQLELETIIALPEMTRGLECRLRDAYDNASAVALEHPDLIDAMEAVVEAYLSEVVRWQPISVGDIKPGMRVRQTWRTGEVTHYAVGVAKRVDASGWVYCVGRMADPDIGAWEVDPRSIPTNPDQEILDLLALWYQQGPKGAVSLLTELRTIADVTPKAVAGDE